MLKKIKKIAPDNFELETNTVWSFPSRGDWATHNAKYRGNWSPYIPRNIILRYSQEHDTVLDMFVGSGTTLIETKLLKRYGIGIDINPESLSIAQNNIDFEFEDDLPQRLILGNAANMNFIKDDSIDLICTHPPYANIIKYSDNIEGDLSHLTVPNFIKEMKKIANECYRVLKKGKYCAILMGDTRQKGCMIPMSFDIMKNFQESGFTLKELIIKEQHNCKATGFWKTNSIKYNFLLIAHEYLFVLKK